jgi:exosortase N
MYDNLAKKGWEIALISILVLNWFYLLVKIDFNFSPTFWIGLLLLIYSLITNDTYEKSFRFWLISLPICLMAIHLKLHTLYFVLATVILISVYESLVEKLKLQSLIIMATISPAFGYVANTFTFPIRLSLTKIVAKVMVYIIPTIKLEGNILILKGTRFTVEPECLGLHMITISILLVVFLLIFFQNQFKKQLSNINILLVLASGLTLNIIANFFRILLLVLFKIEASHPFHEIIGLFSFTIYMVLPMVYMVPKVILRFANNYNPNYILKKNRQLTLAFSTLLVLVQIIFSIIGISKINKKNISAFGVTKLETKNALIYKKLIPSFYAAEHNPTICWKGSGYNLGSIEEVNINGKNIYMGVLEKENEKLYTSWWFTNGKICTNSQLEWRFVALKTGDQFALINLTTSSKMALINETEKYLTIKSI